MSINSLKSEGDEVSVTDRSLEQAFNAVFHDRESFNDFCTLPLAPEVSEIPLHLRKVYRPSDKLKTYLRFIDKVVLRHLKYNASVVHSYIKGSSALTAVQAHAKNQAFFLSDIKSFFPNIGDQDVRKVLMRDSHRIPILDFDQHIERVTKLMTLDGVLPVGFPTSPKLSNGFLHEFDNALAAYCDSTGLTYTRYSDDIIISGMDRAKLTVLREKVQMMLEEHASKSLRLNDEKTRVTHRGNKVKILGLVITPDGQVTIDVSRKHALEGLLHFYATDTEKYKNLLEKTFKGEDKERSLFGMLHYANSCDSEYLVKLQKKYGVLILRTLMEDRWSGNR
ncbi:MAG: reverse transcriptase [Alteromonadaceae bacterium]|nr:MAG: reverse transcriptase [Alteromonadaceae bacterium]